MTSSSLAYYKISAAIDALERNERLCIAENFVERIRAIDFLELHMLDDVAPVNETRIDDSERHNLIQRAGVLKQRLDEANDTLFAHLLARIHSNERYTLVRYFRQVVQQLATPDDEDYVAYDELDILLNGLLEVGSTPGDPQEREPDMIFYQPTPARIVLKLLDELHVLPKSVQGQPGNLIPDSDPTGPPLFLRLRTRVLTGGKQGSGDRGVATHRTPSLFTPDVFYDLGSGLGHVPILVNLLANIQTRGIEIEESYIQFSRERLKKLGLSNVDFINADARHCAYDEGTIFYLYTPFQGEILRQVLSKLEAQAKRREIKICAYGPCTLQVRKQKWLEPRYLSGKEEGSLGIFRSI